MLEHHATSTGSQYARLDALGGMDVARVRYDQCAVARTLHDTYVVGVASGGAHRLWVRGRAWEIRAGSVIVLNPLDVHGFEQIAYAPWSYCFIYPAAHQLFGVDTAHAPRFETPVVDDPDLASIIESTSSRPANVVPTALRMLARHQSDAPAAAGEHRAVARTREILNTCYRSPLRIATIADEVRLSSYHLIRIFRDAVGIPPYAYLDQVRVAKARRLLGAGHAISSAAYLTGFSDQSHLTRHFKRALGVTPGVYCRALRLSRAA